MSLDSPVLSRGLFLSGEEKSSSIRNIIHETPVVRILVTFVEKDPCNWRTVELPNQGVIEFQQQKSHLQRNKTNQPTNKQTNKDIFSLLVRLRCQRSCLANLFRFSKRVASSMDCKRCRSSFSVSWRRIWILHRCWRHGIPSLKRTFGTWK